MHQGRAFHKWLRLDAIGDNQKYLSQGKISSVPSKGAMKIHTPLLKSRNAVKLFLTADQDMDSDQQDANPTLPDSARKNRSFTRNRVDSKFVTVTKTHTDKIKMI